jgi:pyrimidine-nucleoside phosphorylase
MNYNPVEIIYKKRNGGRLSKTEIKAVFEGYVAGKVPDYQLSSLLMAIFFKGMQEDEINDLSEIYIKSGDQIKFPASMKTVDKHSTGGVGDKISIVLAPIVAACGAYIPMISGRGLGHTGGTLDKLESIPGLRTDFSSNEFIEMVKANGFSIISQSAKLVPVDKKIYALRDVTATVESLPLITASIMSKKISEGAQNLVIDLKVGEGAFIKGMQQAKQLGYLLKQTGNNFGQKVTVVYTNMNAPLGDYVGNALEIKESVEFLKGRKIKDIYEITKRLAIEMLILSGRAQDEDTAGRMVDEVITNGKALKFLKDFIAAQGGNSNVCDDTSLLPTAKHILPIIAPKNGWVKAIDSLAIGYALIDLGAGRKTLNSVLDYSTGAYLPFKIGDKIEKGQILGKIFCQDIKSGQEAGSRILQTYKLSDMVIKGEELIYNISRDND